MTRIIVSVISSLSFLALPVQAETPRPVQQNNSNAVWFENWIGLRNATMVVSAPDGQLVSIFAASGAPVFELTGNEVMDGIYRYELNAATEEEVKIVNKINDGRGDVSKDTTAKPFFHSGAFIVQRGVIVELNEAEEEK
ncbi:hypothetical protein [Phaeobacter sp. J2-8]|uniref:hypothetical protein n=1 Tax=Phaeobacter sp. J2-8 TaxID=2931394 RepID=UPI001FD3C11D|nr:hypothetical protein [Phaeobacter sp. J2-8]MCJ7874796.1 hypothetical protein [Phaeobacter sp. J2-8]